MLVAVIATYLIWGDRLASATIEPALPVRPNFVVIQTDDSTLEQLYASFTPYPGAPAIRAMPNTLDLIAKRGATFNRYYASYSLCAPSRASLLTGRYAHNNGVKGNIQPNGGYATGFSLQPQAYNHNLATWLQGGRLPARSTSAKFLERIRRSEPYSSAAEGSRLAGAPGTPSSTPIRIISSMAMKLSDSGVARRAVR